MTLYSCIADKGKELKAQHQYIGRKIRNPGKKPTGRMKFSKAVGDRLVNQQRCQPAICSFYFRYMVYHPV